MLTLLVFLCPPLAVLLTAPASPVTHAVKNFGFTLFFYLPGVLHARATVERYTVQRRYDALMNLLENRPAAVTVPTPLPKLKRRSTSGSRAA